MARVYSRLAPVEPDYALGMPATAVSKVLAAGGRHTTTALLPAPKRRTAVRSRLAERRLLPAFACRSWSAGPVNAFTLWPSPNVHVTKGSEFVGEFRKTERSHRQWCTRCGGHLMTVHPHWNLTDVYAATIPSVPFKPGVHVNYQETVLPMTDGLPKLRDFPSELGGTGEAVPE